MTGMTEKDIEEVVTEIIEVVTTEEEEAETETEIMIVKEIIAEVIAAEAEIEKENKKREAPVHHLEAIDRCYPLKFK
jgi:hypothetical protein